MLTGASLNRKMYREKGRWSLLLILFIWASGYIPLSAQVEYSRFDHLTTADGLSSNRIWCIHRDSKDYLWIGTDLGLDRYDSYEFKKYRFDENNPRSVSSDKIISIYEDSNSNLWFGTINGLNLYDRTKDNFTVFKNIPGDNTSLNGNIINSIIEDRNGNLWFVTDANCLNKWIPETSEFVRYPFEEKPDALYARTCRMIGEDSKGNLWIVSLNGGISRFEPETGIFRKYDDPSVNFGPKCFKNIYIDDDDKIWITTDGNGFFSYDPAGDRFVQYGYEGDGKGTNRRIILHIIPEDDRYLLLAVDQGGLNRFDKINGTFEYFMRGQTGQEGLNHNGMWCLHKDKDGILWIGTSGGGINYFNPRKNRFKLYSHNGDNPRSLSFDIALSFYEDHEGKIWIGTDGGGVNIFDPTTRMFTAYEHDPSDPYSISGNVIRYISEDSDHNVWIGTWDAGLNRFERETGRFIRYMPDPDDPNSLSSSNIWSLHVDHRDILWLANFSIGPDLFDLNRGVIERFRNDPKDSGSISSNDCWMFYEDHNKNMWICTENGLNLYDRETNSFKVFDFPGNVIVSFCVDHKDNLWVGTSTKGVFYCKPDGTVIYNYNIYDGLRTNRIQAIVEDNNGDLWFSTSDGISHLDPETREIRNYSKDDGLQGDQFFQQAFLKTRDGEIYFGGYHGFNSFYPDSLKDNNLIPPVYITDFQIFNKEVEYEQGGQFPMHISEAQEIRLKWQQSVFSFSFAAINYTYPGKNQYAYIMEGFDREWNITDASWRHVTYTNLDPGTYTFRVKASNNDGVWNEEGVSLQLVIMPPWWKTLWFKLLGIGLVISSVVAFFMSRVRRLHHQKIILEKLVSEKTEKLTELNASKDKLLSIIAHDLKNPFNTIIGFSGILKEEIEKGNNDSVEEYAGLINSSAVHTLRLLENLLEWSCSQRGKIIFDPKPVKLMALCREELYVLKEIAESKEIDLVFLIPEELVVFADRNMMKTILRNLISNAIKFTNRNGRVEIKASPRSDGGIEVIVSDNGIGMTQETIDKLFRIDSGMTTLGTEKEKGTGLGLLLCQEFVRKHGGEIHVDSVLSQGSVFSFFVPSDKETDG